MKIIIGNPNIKDIIKVSDDVLKKTGRGDIPEHIKGQAAMSTLKNILEKKYFSICEVDALSESNGVFVSEEHHRFMRSLHCVDFANMTPQVREYLAALLVDYFKGNIVMSGSYVD